jgi:hypothetical protein
MNLIKKYKWTLITVFFYTSNVVNGQNSDAEKGLQGITMNTIRAQLEFIASDWMEGREAGEKGEYLAADYIASMLRLYGVKPWEDPDLSKSEHTYFQKFALIKSVIEEDPELMIKSSEGAASVTISLTRNVDFTTRNIFQSLEVESPIVYAGYGLIDQKIKKKTLKESDIKGKFILRIAAVPKMMDRETYFASDRETEKILKSMGASGIIEFNPMIPVIGNPSMDYMNASPSEKSPESGRRTESFSLPDKNPPDKFVRISISAKIANELLDGTGINPEEYINKDESGSTFLVTPLQGKSIYLKTNVKTSQVGVRNILGIIEGNNPDKIIVLGAHYDHVGMKNGYIWNGADDNGSGTVGVMTLAKAIMETGHKPENTIIIALWAAEEKGLLGSRYYVRNLNSQVKNIKLNVNFDMISRYISDDKPNAVTMTYSSSKPAFQDLTMENIKKYGIDLEVDYQPSDDPPGGSDHRSFTAAGIPVMRFKPGHREEYHTPYDESQTLDWDIMEKIIKISFLNVWELANSDF